MDRRRSAGALLVTLVLPLVTSCTPTEADTSSVVVSAKIRSVTLSSRRAVETGTFDDIVRLGATHVTIVPFGHQKRHDDPDVRFDPGTRWFSESDQGIRAMAVQSRERGLGTILKPHIWVGGFAETGMSRDRINFENEIQWGEWEAAYRTFILHYAELAAEIGSDVFVVGTELASAARGRPKFWSQLVAEVRTVFPGALTYAANWYREYEDVRFWQHLDLVGVQAYFPIHGADNPTAVQLREGWSDHRASLRQLSSDTQRPVIFTEIGYRSVASAAREPWTWASRNALDVETPDTALQARLYSAFFEAMWEEPWFGGAILWRWHAGRDSDRAIREIDFTPQNKPSEEVVRQWFSR